MQNYYYVQQKKNPNHLVYYFLSSIVKLKFLFVQDCIEVLLGFDARINAFTSISTEKLTPLILACQKGFLPIVKYLIEQGAKVEGRDRFKRTSSIHVYMYGNAHIVFYLLRLEANANVFDPSSNTALHYVIAYGWYFCVRLLIEAGANINCRNYWQTTCLEEGFSKGLYAHRRNDVGTYGRFLW